MAELESAFETIRQCTYRIDVEPLFIEQFFADRRCISTITSRFLKTCDGQTANTTGKLVSKLHAGNHLFGLSTVEEHYVLSKIITIAKPKRVIEIGVFRGHTALTMARALAAAVPESTITGIDVDDNAISIASEVLTTQGLSAGARFTKSESQRFIPSEPTADFIFIDGDHSFEATAKDFVVSYNNIGRGGIIAMHDVGCKVWGYHLGPGWLFHHVLPTILLEKIDQSWLDSMCRELTMQLLSPVSSLPQRFCVDDRESFQLACLTSRDTILGHGGLGFVVKLDSTHSLSLDDVLGAKPKVADKQPGKNSPLGRAARRLAEYIP